jgi:hypothetical protein
VVKGLDIDPFSRQMMDRSLAELQAERSTVHGELQITV